MDPRDFNDDEPEFWPCGCPSGGLDSQKRCPHCDEPMYERMDHMTCKKTNYFVCFTCYAKGQRKGKANDDADAGEHGKNLVYGNCVYFIFNTTMSRNKSGDVDGGAKMASSKIKGDKDKAGIGSSADKPTLLTRRSSDTSPGSPSKRAKRADASPSDQDEVCRKLF